MTNNEQFYSLVDLIQANNYINPEYYEKYNVKRGLRNRNGTGVLTGLTLIGDAHGYIMDENEKVDVKGSLYYRGINVVDLVNGCRSEDRFGFEETAYLLLFGDLPTAPQLKGFRDIISDSYELPKEFAEDMILKAPSKDIMNKLARSVLALYSYDDNPDATDLGNLLRQSIELIARFPVLTAYAYQTKRHNFDGQGLFLHKPVKEYSIAENFLHLMRPTGEFTEEEAKILDLALILHAEHGGGNNSAFTTHVVSSSGTDSYAAISAALGSLKGPKHGGANLQVIRMIEDIKENVPNWLDEGSVADYLEKMLRKEAGNRSGLIYGMGHAVYTLSDPRAVLLKENAKKLAKIKQMEDDFALYDMIERLTPEVFCKVRNMKHSICANVDLYSGFVYSMLDIAPELYTPIFAVSRIVGWCAHRIEEIMTGGKIIRPAYKSVSQKREYYSIKDRA